MSPEEDIESLLKAYAKKRREAVGEAPALHPVQRRQLQEEVRRVYGPSPSEPAPGWWSFLFRPRFAFGVALCAVLALALVYSLQLGSRDKDLAYQSSPTSGPSADPSVPPARVPARSGDSIRPSDALSSLTLTPATSPTSTPALPVPKAVRLSQPTVDTDGLVPSSSPLEVAAPTPNPARGLASRPAPAPASPTPAAPSAPTPTTTVPLEGNTQRSYGVPASSNQAITLADASTPAPTPALTTSDGDAMEAAVAPRRRMSLSNEARGTAELSPTLGLEIVGRWQFAPPPSPGHDSGTALGRERQPAFQVLHRFAIESTASGVVLRDQDGSVYRGSWIASDGRTQPGTQLAYTFETAGTNRTTGKAVHFVGQLELRPRTVEAVDGSRLRQLRLQEALASGSTPGEWWIQGSYQEGDGESSPVEVRYQAR